MISDLACSKGKATVVVPCCPGQKNLGVIDPSKGKGQQLPVFGIWHNIATRSVVEKSALTMQIKCCKNHFYTVFCRVMNEDY